MSRFGSWRCRHLLIPAIVAVGLSACASDRTAVAPPPCREAQTLLPTGTASWYGGQYHGRRTANGERFDMNQLSAAHRDLPFGTRLRVTNLENGKSVVLVVNDRGPFAGDRLIDVSKRAADDLGFTGQGTARVSLAVISSCT